MKDITKIKEYNLLKNLPSKINQKEVKIKKLQSEITSLVDEIETLESKHKNALKGGNYEERKSLESRLNTAKERLPKLTEKMDALQDELSEAKDKLSEAKVNFAKKATPVIDDLLEDFQKSVKRTQELNSTLKEIEQAASFGVIGNRMKVLPTTLPTIKFYKNGCGRNPVQQLENKIKAWNDAK